MSCPTCGVNEFTNECPKQHGQSHKNTAVYRNVCINGHRSFYSEKTRKQTKVKPKK